MVAHSVGPPLASKAVPWLQLARLTSGVWALMAIRVGAIPAGVVTGWRLHAMLDQRQIYRISYGLLIVAALKLLWDGMGGLFRLNTHNRWMPEICASSSADAVAEWTQKPPRSGTLPLTKMHNVRRRCVFRRT
ncbi:hypothetical protein NUV26_18885 [Burkholderia pseudomultivorans]|uniref:hypothetical protein n=1 Tax=Burkholderia pseudomultivorans TaxID=1207504 RepID=UPI001E396E28|nr:hypothetical protein [Burkholderia pseudomultivorans]MDS0794233.1 hypothetical protein [Burkholderia pseudomultivorans]